MGDTMPSAGMHFGKYRLNRLIGSGGMGSVYEAHDTVLDRVVAVKLISGTYVQDPEYRQRLQREARLAGRVQDPHVVPVHSTGEIDGQLYVEMRLINGTDLDTVLKRSGPLPPARALAVLRQVASALDAAHAAGVLHRDVKPANILVSADDFTYLVDFGIANAASEAKLTELGDVLGTISYMAPERFDGDGTTVGPRADIYALACVLFEALTGSPPFLGDRVSLLGAHVTQPVPRISARTGLPAALDNVIARGMAKHPGARFATASDLIRAAEAALSTMGAATTRIAPPGGPPIFGVAGPAGGPPAQWPGPWAIPPAPPAIKRHRWLPIAAAVAVVALVAGLGIWRLSSGKSAHAGPPGLDVSKLDVGHYPTQPHPLPGPATVEDGRYLESFRLAEGIIDPYQVDPRLAYLSVRPTPDPAAAATQISGTGTPLVQPVLEQYGMISAFAVGGYSKPPADFAREKRGDLLVVLVTSFPNDEAAAHAATDIDATDFAVNPANHHTVIPGYPQAIAHYRPDSPSLGVTMASGELVVSLLVRSDTTPGLESLQRRVQRTFDLQLPLMAQLKPYSESGLTLLPLDPDGMLRRAFTAVEQTRISTQFASMGPRAAELCANSQARRDQLFAQGGIDRCAVTAESTLFRARDDDTAHALVPELIDADSAEFTDHEVAAPAGLDGSRCFEQKQKIWATEHPQLRFVCWLSFGRYIAEVQSTDETDARQRAAAQYVLLVNNA